MSHVPLCTSYQRSLLVQKLGVLCARKRPHPNTCIYHLVSTSGGGIRLTAWCLKLCISARISPRALACTSGSTVSSCTRAPAAPTNGAPPPSTASMRLTNSRAAFAGTGTGTGKGWVMRLERQRTRVCNTQQENTPPHPSQSVTPHPLSQYRRGSNRYCPSCLTPPKFLRFPVKIRTSMVPGSLPTNASCS